MNFISYKICALVIEAEGGNEAHVFFAKDPEAYAARQIKAATVHAGYDDEEYRPGKRWLSRHSHLNLANCVKVVVFEEGHSSKNTAYPRKLEYENALRDQGFKLPLREGFAEVLELTSSALQEAGIRTRSADILALDNFADNCGEEKGWASVQLCFHQADSIQDAVLDMMHEVLAVCGYTFRKCMTKTGDTLLEINPAYVEEWASGGNLSVGVEMTGVSDSHERVMFELKDKMSPSDRKRVMSGLLLETLKARIETVTRAVELERSKYPEMNGSIDDILYDFDTEVPCIWINNSGLQWRMR